jgi:hypothetical protein
MKKVLVSWFLIFSLIALVVFFAAGPNYLEAVAGVGLAALISLLLIFKTLNEQWSGTVTDIKTETITSTDSDGDVSSRNITYAYIKLDSGKVKKTPAYPQWKIGDRLEKVKGQSAVQTIGQS